MTIIFCYIWDMWKTVTKIEDYVPAMDIRNYPFDYGGRIERTINGRRVSLKDDKWAWHFHIKVNNACNAKCGFCVEQNSRTPEDPGKLLDNSSLLIDELRRNSVLFSVSVTGGEPTLYSRFGELADMLRGKNIPFLSMNTNGCRLRQNLANIAGNFRFVDVSRHAVDDGHNRAIFRTETVPALSELREMKASGDLGSTKLRIQSVVCEDVSLDDFQRMVEAYSFADDISFRRLMVLDDSYGVDYDRKDEAYYALIDYCVAHGKLVFQAIQDYYTYECWNMGGVLVNFSYSDMAKVLEMERQEDEAIFREFICHPNGVISGSWKENKKVVYA